jgi:hypothetical protein
VRLLAASACCLALTATALKGQAAPELSDLLDALGRASATFARSAPGLTARETLTQRGRQGSMEIAGRGRVQYRNFRIPPGFRIHEVVSDYSLGQVGTPPVIHEVRTAVMVDGAPVHNDAEVRHALTLGLKSPDDETKKKLLENLEHSQLTGAVTDFGPVLLLFTAARQSHYRFVYQGARGSDPENLAGELFFVVHYQQISGMEGVTEFRARAEERHPAEGEIWLRQSDLLPLRVTVNTAEVLSKKYTLRNDAEVNYQPTPFGLAPASVIHKQFLNGDLLVENNFRYSDYHGPTPNP